ncbi:MAG: cupredoxin domain-containing protein [Acidimicrobiia bacterium]
MRRVTPTLVICLAAATATAVALARPADPAAVSSTGAADARLVIDDFAFGAVTAAAGASVAAVNQDGASHTVTSADGLFDTGPIASGAESSFTAPAEPGTYPFFCAIHPSMSGQVVVEG